MTLQIEKLPEVIKRTGRSRSSIYLGIKEGTFPKPIKLGARSIGWPSTVIDEWIEERIRESALQGLRRSWPSKEAKESVVAWYSKKELINSSI